MWKVSWKVQRLVEDFSDMKLESAEGSLCQKIKKIFKKKEKDSVWLEQWTCQNVPLQKCVGVFS